MALLGRTEQDQSSYLELAELISNRGHLGHIEANLRELFRRVLFTGTTSNRDDHMRNHGLTREQEGWRLAPAYDMHPTTKRGTDVLALDEVDAHPDIGLMLATAKYYRMNPESANAEWRRLRDALGAWRAPSAWALTPRSAQRSRAASSSPRVRATCPGEKSYGDFHFEL